jgi:NADH-quinone oxidoreductase subunit M
MEHLLSTIIALPLIGGVGLLIVPWEKIFGKNEGDIIVRWVGLFVSLVTFLVSLLLWVGFDNCSGQFQFVESFRWIPSLNLTCTLGIDGISLFFVLLTTLLVPLCLLGSWEVPGPSKNIAQYNAAFLIMEGFILLVFTVLDLLVFYVFFEAVLIPMFLIIGIWGSRERKIRAAYFFFLYTLLGSVLMLLALLVIYFSAGTTDYLLLVQQPLSENRQYLLWLAFFASFAVKVPMVPVHIWLPEAHVEAPTAGSVILAGILLKLGTYGLVRFSLPLFPVASIYFTPLVYAMAIVAVIYTSLTAIRQTDMKRIIAYASVAHMNLTLVGLFSLTTQGVEGSLLQMLSHGLVSGALFLCVGVLYDRYHSRMVKYYSGLAHSMPMYATVFLFFTMANIALPGTSSFVGEFMILLGTFQVNTFAAVLSATGMILGGAYSLWLYNRIAYGNLRLGWGIGPIPMRWKKGGNVSLSNDHLTTKIFGDLSRREFMIFIPLVILTLWMGVYPEIFLNPMHLSCANLLGYVTVGA